MQDKTRLAKAFLVITQALIPEKAHYKKNEQKNHRKSMSYKGTNKKCLKILGSD
jgi:hypothetical protein